MEQEDEKMSDENPNIELYEESAYADDAIRFEDLDYAIIGTTHTGYFVYSYERMIEHFVSADDMTIDEAIEWIDHNVMWVNGGEGFVILYSDEQI